MDKDAFAARVTAMQQSLYRVAASYLRGEADRLDAVCEAIARAWEKRGTLRDDRLFSTWITRILIRECVNIQRRQRRSVPVDVLPEQIQEEESGDIRSLREAIETLPQRQRTMLVLHYMEDYDVRRSRASWAQPQARCARGFPGRARRCAGESGRNSYEA